MRTLKTNVTTVKCSQANQTVATCHVRHIFKPVNQTIRKPFISSTCLSNVTIQSHPIKDGCYKTNEKCWIVATINPISCSHPVHHGIFFSVLTDKFIVCKHREIIIFSQKYFKNKENKQSNTLS